MVSRFHNQKEAACIQLERAIKLFLEEEDYYSALTLAGAAEEIFGQMVERSGAASAFTQLHGRFDESLTQEERKAIRGDGGKGTKDGVKIALNSARNWLKHSDGTEDTMYMDIEQEAFDLLERAVESRWLLLRDDTPSTKRFHVYASERYCFPVFSKTVCPLCGQLQGVPLLWGEPDSRAWGAYLRGEVMLAGCVVETPTNGLVPENGCLDCNHRWCAPWVTSA